MQMGLKKMVSTKIVSPAASNFMIMAFLNKQMRGKRMVSLFYWLKRDIHLHKIKPLLHISMEKKITLPSAENQDSWWSFTGKTMSGGKALQDALTAANLVVFS